MTAPASTYHAILLAAGMGSRFGGSKLTAPWKGGVLLDAALRSAHAAPVSSVWVVVGAHRAEMTVAVGAFLRGNPAGPKVELVTCEDHALGISASLARGLSALPADAAGAFIFLGDMPAIPPGLAACLLGHLKKPILAVAPVAHGQRGHPVLISAELFDRFRRMSGDRGGRVILDGLGDRLATVEVDDAGILADIDTAADLQVSENTRCRLQD